MTNYISASNEQGQKFYLNFHNKGKVVMLNLLRFKETADYSSFEELAPASPVSGQEAYQLYMECTRPLLADAGSKVLFYGSSQHFLIGPSTLF